MKDKIIIALISVLLGGIGGFVIDFYLLNQSGASKTVYGQQTVSTAESQERNEQLEKDEEEDEKLVRQQSAARIDYPLIDIYFDKKKEYKVIITEFGNKQKVYKEYADTGDFFQFHKEQFSIMAVPSGRGTTTKYVLNVYEENECIKTMDCIGIRTDFGTLSLKTAAISVTEAKPDLTQSTGADGAMLYYADEKRIIFGGSFGLFVYDTVNQTMLRSVDLAAIGCSYTQGDNYCEIQVAEDGRQVYLHPVNITDMYIYDVEKNSLKKEAHDLTGISFYSGVQKGNSSAIYQTSDAKAELHLSHAWSEIGQLGYYISGEGPVKKFFVPDEYNKAPLLASSDFHGLKKAEMMVHGEMYTCDSTKALQKLEKIISKAKVMEGYPACPFEDALYLTKEDGSMAVIYPATDSCNVIGTEDGYVEFGGSTNSEFWKILGWSPEMLR